MDEVNPYEFRSVVEPSASVRPRSSRRYFEEAFLCAVGFFCALVGIIIWENAPTSVLLDIQVPLAGVGCLSGHGLVSVLHRNQNRTVWVWWHLAVGFGGFFACAFVGRITNIPFHLPSLNFLAPAATTAMILYVVGLMFHRRNARS